MIKRNTALSRTSLFAAILVGISINTQVSASNAGAFLGGVLATKVVGNMRDRTEAEQEQAYYAQQSAQQPVAQQSAPAQQDSAEDRIKELDKLAAGGYITPEEYKAKKKAIVDSM